MERRYGRAQAHRFKPEFILVMVVAELAEVRASDKTGVRTTRRMGAQHVTC